MTTSTENSAHTGVDSEKPPTVSVIIPCRNEAEHIASTLQSILDQQPPPGGFEVIVADGRSADGTREILMRLAEQDSRVRIVDNPNLIVSGGLNLAVREARGSVIVRMDAHTEYSNDYIRSCLEVLRSTGANNVGGPWVAKGTGLVGRAIAAAFQSPFSFGGTRGHNRVYEGPVDTVYLGCWPREVFERVGLFDEQLVRNQDDEFNLRLTRAGGKIWQSPAIKSCYITRNSLFALFSQYMQYGYWKVRVIQKHNVPASVRHLVPGGSLIFLFGLFLLSFSWPLALWSWIGLVGLYGIVSLTASLVSAAHDGWDLFPLLPIVFASYHCAYGWGFLCGVFEFVILRRRPSERYATLTRYPAKAVPTQISDPRPPLEL